jgi:NAD-dependent deacetylase
MHGEMAKARCTGCEFVVAWHEDLATTTPCPTCGAKGGMRPHVVWFGEMPLELDRIAAAIEACGLFVSIGTSGNVYPAAGFVAEARRHGRARTVELNLEPSAGASLFDDAAYGPATRVVPEFVERLLA